MTSFRSNAPQHWSENSLKVQNSSVYALYLEGSEWIPAKLVSSSRSKHLHLVIAVCSHFLISYPSADQMSRS